MAPASSPAASVTSHFVTSTREPQFGVWNWAYAPNWSTNPYAPNNDNPAGTTYDAVIDFAPGASTVSVSIASPVTLDSLTINSPKADVRVSSIGSLRAINGINIVSGAFALDGGRLVDTRLSGGAVVVGNINAALDNVTLANTVLTARTSTFANDPSRVLTVQNNLALDNAIVRLQGNTQSRQQRLKFVGANTLGGTGEVVFDGDASPWNASDLLEVDAAGLTIGPGVTLRTGDSNAIVNVTAKPLLNQGTISARTNARFIDLLNVTNTGTLEATNGGVLNLVGNWSNTGTIRIGAGGIFSFGGVNTIAALGSVQRNGGIVQYTGTLNNAGSTYDLSTTPAGPLDFAEGAVVNGGTLTSSNPAATPTVRFIQDEQTEGYGGQAVTFDGVTLDTNLNVSSGALVAKNNLTLLNGHTISLVTAPGADQTLLSIDKGRGELMFHFNSTLGGNGVVSFDGAASANVVQSSGGNLTIAPGITIRTGTQGGFVGAFAGAQVVTNQGTVAAQTPGKTLVVRGPNFVNNGTFRADAGTLELAGNSTTAGLGNIVITGGQVIFSGTINNAAAALNTANYPGATFKGTIVGGNVVATAAPFVVPPAHFFDFAPVGGATLQDVNFTGTMNVGALAKLTLVNAVTFDNASVNFPAGGSVQINKIGFQTVQPTLSGTADIVFANGPSTITLRDEAAIGPGITFRTAAGGATPAVVKVDPSTQAAAATFAAVTPGGAFHFTRDGFFGGVFKNLGTFEALNGGAITIASEISFTNIASNTLTGGKYLVGPGGTINLAGRTFTTNDADVTLDGAGSTFAALAPLASNPGKFTLRGGRNFSTVGALANAGTLHVGHGSTLTVNGPLTNTGKIHGNGTIAAANVTSSGTIAPGDSPGALRIAGNLALSSGSVLAIEVGGTRPGVDYDLLDVDGTVTLDGTLAITFVNGFAPAPDYVFDFLDFAGATGAFDVVSLPELPAGVTWDVAALSTGGPTGVPEPAGAGLLGCASAWTLLARGRRHRALTSSPR